MVGNDNGVVYDEPETTALPDNSYIAPLYYGAACGIVGGVGLLAGIHRYAKYSEAGSATTYFVIGALFLALMLCFFGNSLYRLAADSYTEWWDGQRKLDESDTIHTYTTPEPAAS